MKPFLIFLFLFFISFSLYPQDQHTYGPVREQDWGTYWLLPKSSPEGGGEHYIGVNAGPPVVKYICFLNWQWNNQNIPSEATLTSIDIAFKARSMTYAQRNLPFTFHWIESNWENIDINYYTTQVTYNDDRKIFEDNVVSNSSGYVTYTATVTGADFLAKIQTAITNVDNSITLAMRSEDGSAPWWRIYPMDNGSSTSPSIDITFHYTTQTQNFTFYNKIGSNESYGALVLDNDYQHPFPSGTTKHPAWGSHTIRTDELPFAYNWNQSGTTQKHLFWGQTGEADRYVVNNDFQANASNPVSMWANFDPTSQVHLVNKIEGIDGGSGFINFVDPFYYYKDNNIWYQSNEPKKYTSPFTTYNNSDNAYGGVFLHQDPTFDPNVPNYSVQAISPQNLDAGGTLGIRKFYFQSWSAEPVNSASFQNVTALTTAVVFNNSGATVKANLKGQGLSNNSEGYSLGSQRKIVRTVDYQVGYLHRVYESMGHVWYEISINNGQSWTLMNNGKPLDVSGGSHPSIDWVLTNGPLPRSYIVITFQQKEPGTGYHYSIQAVVFAGLIAKDGNSIYSKIQTETVYSGYESSQINTTPVIAMYPAYQGAGVQIVWHTNSGLRRQQANITNLSQDPLLLSGSSSILSGTTLSSINPSIDAFRNGNLGGLYGLAWEDNRTIWYAKIYPNGVIQGTAYNVSGQDGFSYNNTPSVYMTSQTARVVWLAKHYQIMSPVVVYKGVDADRYWNFSYGARSLTINSDNDDNYFAFAWSESGNLKFVDNTLSTIRSISGITAQDVQLSNGVGSSSMYVDALNTATAPFYFLTSNNLSTYYSLEKVTGLAEMHTGRQGVISADSVQFYFMLGDITIENNPIGFISLNDSITINTKNDLNQCLLSSPISINDNSQFLYSVCFGTTDSLAAANLLGENGYVNFLVTLIDESTGEVLGVLDDITFTPDNLTEYDNISYEVNTSGIGNRTVRLKLTVDNNFDALYSLTDAMNDQDVLEKRASNMVDYNNGIDLITTYDMFQNYPNPFNPATTINYQLPKTGFVTIKIYDILGKEVATLVNEQKTQGRYSVNFDASRLASGVYIYQLRANDYVSSKKMLLLK